MNVEQMTNEELDNELWTLRDKPEEVAFVRYASIVNEAARRLRNSIPKPVVEVKRTHYLNWMVVVNGEVMCVRDKQDKANHYATTLRKALGLEGGGDAD